MHTWETTNIEEVIVPLPQVKERSSVCVGLVQFLVLSLLWSSSSFPFIFNLVYLGLSTSFLWCEMNSGCFLTTALIPFSSSHLIVFRLWVTFTSYLCLHWLLYIGKAFLSQYCARICSAPINNCPLFPPWLGLDAAYHWLDCWDRNKPRSVECLKCDHLFRCVNSSRISAGWEECQYVVASIWCPRRMREMTDPEWFHLPIVQHSCIPFICSLCKACLLMDQWKTRWENGSWLALTNDESRWWRPGLRAATDWIVSPPNALRTFPHRSIWAWRT